MNSVTSNSLKEMVASLNGHRHSVILLFSRFRVGSSFQDSLFQISHLAFLLVIPPDNKAVTVSRGDTELTKIYATIDISDTSVTL